MTENGDMVDLTEDDINTVKDAMFHMACTGLRCLGICYRIYGVEQINWKSRDSFKLEDAAAEELFEEMVWIGCTGIKDPVRPEVPDAVATCQKAGIVVRMVTGDHLETAKHIAKECGILTSKDHVWYVEH